MDRNTILGFVLIAVILIGFSIFNFNQRKEELKRQIEQQKADSTRLASQPPAPVFSDSVPGAGNTATVKIDTHGTVPAVSSDSLEQVTLEKKYGSFAAASSGEEKLVTLENEDLKIVFSTKGAAMQMAELKKYDTHDSLPLILFQEGDNSTNLHFFTRDNLSINTKDLFFTVEESPGQVIFRLSAGENKFIEKKYTFRTPAGEKDKAGSYMLDYSLRLVGMNDVMASNTTLTLDWKRRLRQLEHSKKSEDSHTSTFYKLKDESPSTLPTMGEGQESFGAFTWISYKQQFFNTSIINTDGFSSGTLKSSAIEDPGYLKSMEAEFVLAYKNSPEQSYSMSYYLGPNHYQTLKSLDMELEDIVMVTGFMSWISVVNKWLVIPVFNWLEGFNLNYGIIILILTILIKVILFPLSYKAYKSMAMMKVLQPELNELREKHKDDQQKFAAEQWKLFQSAGVSPLGGCLPQLLQFPILVAMYYFFPASIELRQESFLWAHDLSTYDSIFNFGFEIPFYGDHVSLFTLLMTVTSVLYAVTQPQVNTGQPFMKYLPFIFPVILLPVFNSFPAALTYYYFLQNILGYLQQWLTKKFIINEEELHKKIQENKKKPVKKSMWQMRLEEIAKQQKEKQQQLKKQKK